MTKYISIYLLMLVSIVTYAQAPAVPVPAAKQSKPIAIVNATIHVGNGTVIENGSIVFENGKITAIGKNLTIDRNTEQINANQKHLYPGFIGVSTALGLTEVGAVRATNDRDEVGDLNPNVRSLIAFNTDSHVIPTVRSNGVLMAQVAPQGDALITGLSSVVQLDAWNWEDASYKTDDALFMNWANMFKTDWENPSGPRTIKSDKYAERIANAKALFDEAKAYCQDNAHNPKNLKLAAMCGLFDGQKRLFVRVELAREIVDVVNFAKQYGIKLAIVGGRDAWKVTDLLKANNVAVVLKRTHNLPDRTDEDVDLPYKMPKLLSDAGIDYCITSGSGWDSFWDMRNLPFEAGTAAGFGLTREQALSSITANAARILGIDATVGTLEVGKDATLLLSSGDVLDMRTSNIEAAYIQGRQVDLDNKQKALYRKFMGKYGLPIKE